METLWFWIAVLAYFAAVMAVGVVLQRREKARAAQAGQGLEFWIARRELPGWWLGVSVTAGWLMLGWLSYGMARSTSTGPPACGSSSCRGSSCASSSWP